MIHITRATKKDRLWLVGYYAASFADILVYTLSLSLLSGSFRLTMLKYQED